MPLIVSILEKQLGSPKLGQICGAARV